MAVRCGIDLGTTYSAISWFDSYNNRVDTIDLDSADGAKIIRSVVYYPEGGQLPVVGEAAWNMARQLPERVIVGIKRAMGSSFRAGPIDGLDYTPPQVSAEILKTVARDAEIFLAEEARDVVITVPAYFGDNERAATLEAGQLAGLNVLELLPEPHAAALAFAVDKVADIVDKHLLVYDLGGGTFDVTLIHATTVGDHGDSLSLNIKTLCKDGNAALGGLDWDRALAELVAEKMQQEHGVDVWADPKNEAALLDNCEKAKRNLSKKGMNNVFIVGDFANHQVEVTLAEFEERTSDLLMQTQFLLERVLEDAEKQGISRDQIEVLLTGGSSKMPMVKKIIQGVTGRAPLQHRNPELLVTIGAAYWAHLLQEGSTVSVPVPDKDGTTQTKKVLVPKDGLVDTSIYAIGVAALRRDAQGEYVSFNSVVVPAGAAYNETFPKEFATSNDNMTEIPITLYKGDAPDLDECELLMTFTITGLPPKLPQGTRVKVTLGYDTSGILRGTATVETGQQVEIVVERGKL